jgi:hypothetical protein
VMAFEKAAKTWREKYDVIEANKIHENFGDDGEKYLELIGRWARHIIRQFLVWKRPYLRHAGFENRPLLIEISEPSSQFDLIIVRTGAAESCPPDPLSGPANFECAFGYIFIRVITYIWQIYPAFQRCHPSAPPHRVEHAIREWNLAKAVYFLSNIMMAIWKDREFLARERLRGA